MAPDVAVVAQDPRFGGGVRAQIDPFLRATEELGRSPQLLCVTQRGLRGTLPARYSAARIRGTKAPLDALNQLVGGERLAAPAREARTRWVVSTTASYGWAALRSRRRYGIWVGTSLEDEWAGRRAGLSVSRRVALAANAPLLRKMERAVVRRADVLCATSASSRAGLARAASLDEHTIRILPIPVDVDVFRPIPEHEWQRGLERPVILFAGRGDDPRKNVSLLLQAFPLIRSRLPEARLVLLGRRPDVRLPDGAEALGEVPSVAEYLPRAALFVLPSLQEGFGVVAAEALASGVPVLSTPCSGPEDLLTRSGGGRVLDGFSVEELAAGAVEMLESREELTRLRQAGRAFVEREHTPAAFRQLLSALYEELDGHA